MSTVTFDTLKFAKRLEDAGLTPAQAAAITEAQKDSLSQALDTGLATKTDIDTIRREILEMENRLIKWGIGLALGQAALIAALVKLL